MLRAQSRMLYRLPLAAAKRFVQPVGWRAAALSTSATMRLKESSSQTETDHEHHKQDSLAKQRKGTGHWKPELASDSEEALKADRQGGERRSKEEDIAALQEQTKKVAEEKAKRGTSSHDGV